MSLFIFFSSIAFYVYAACMNMHHVHAWYLWAPKNVYQISLDWSYMVVTHFVGSGNLAHVLYRSSKCS